ncbi:MAG: hypothetical protein FWF29_12980 [Treponema sp.]|nr:hypothetical protein [Treponema sp.]
MSEETPVATGSMDSKNVFFQELKDRLLLAAWIAGLALIGALAWRVSQPLLYSYLEHSVNLSMQASGETVRVTNARSVPSAKRAQLGMWYSVAGSEDMFFVFPVFQDGVLSVCGAILSPENKVERILPVSAHARQVFSQLAPGITGIYVQRIEGAVAARSNNE